MADPVPHDTTMRLVAATYAAQQLKHGHKADSLHHRATPNLKRLRVLTEEVGEVARELDDDEPLDLTHLREELAQTASVCLAWLDATDPDDQGEHDG